MKSLLACLVLVAAAAATLAPAHAEPARPWQDEWIVVLDDTRPERRRGWSSGVGYSGNFNYADDPKLARLARSIAEDYALEVTRQWPIRALGVHCVVVRVESARASVLDELRDDQRVRWVQPLQEFEGLGTSDPYRHLQGSLDIMNVAPLHTQFTGHGIRIAMIDSGVEHNHPDLEHALSANVDFVGSGADAERHGTGIAGVLVAASRNGEGISGVAPAASLYAYRACWENDTGGTRCNSLTLSLALDHALTIQPQVVNLSLTGPEDRLLDALVRMLVDSGAFVVAAHDRERGASRFPSLQEGVLIVHDGTGVSVPEQNAVYAPGGNVLTAQPGHAYDYMGGSSLSAAHVSGVLALLLEAEPALTATETVDRLRASVRATQAVASIDACIAMGCSASGDACASCASAAGN